MNKHLSYNDIASENYYDFILEQLIPCFDKINISGIHFRLHLKPQFGTQEANHRMAIREHIVFEYDKSLKFREKKSIVDLTVLPQSLSYYFSISHSAHLGGYVASNFPVGLDIELVNRVDKAILHRICSDAELKQIDHFPEIDPQTLNTVIWSAKESCFKALHIAKTETQPTPTPTVISDITITLEKPLSFNETFVLPFSCESKNPELLKVNKGFAVQVSNHICTIFFL